MKSVCSPNRSLLAIMAWVLLALVAFAPGRAWAAAEDDDADDAPKLMVVGDFNRDGIADIAEATLAVGDHAGPNLLTVMLGQKNGLYKPFESSVELGRKPKSMVSGDFNRDGIPDLIVGDDDGSLTLFLGDGTGRLISAGAVAHLDSVVSITVADFNHDGIPDLAVTDWRASTLTVMLGIGGGAFGHQTTYPLRMRGTMPHVAAADFNGDGVLDLAVVYNDDSGDTYEIMLGNGNGTFTDAPSLSLARDPNSHCAT